MNNRAKALMKFWKTITGLAALWTVVYGGAQYINYQNARQYLENNLAKILQIQETELGIQHFGVPQIKFAIPPILYREFNFLALIGQYYDVDNGTIYLNPITISGPEPSIWKDITDFLFIGSPANVKCSVQHELGHRYADQLSKAIGKGNFPVLVRSRSGSLRYVELNQNVVSEGIAQNFVISGECRLDKKEFDKFPEDLDKLKSNLYFYGYHLAKPILKKFGTRNGIEHIIQNLPSESDLINLSAYQRRIMNIPKLEAK